MGLLAAHGRPCQPGSALGSVGRVISRLQTLS